MSKTSAAIEVGRLKQSCYWREQDGRAVIEAWRRSGLPLATFARQHGLGATRVRWWRNRLDERAPQPPSAPVGLIPVTVVGTSIAVTKPPTMEIVLASGHVVRVRDDFNAEALVKLVRVLETSC